MYKLKNKLQFEGTDVEFIKSIFKLTDVKVVKPKNV